MTHGADSNPVAVAMAQENLAAFGYQAQVALADMLAYRQGAEALVTDLPYGRYMQMDEPTMRRLLAHGRDLAPRAVYVAGKNISSELQAVGHDDVTVYTVEKHAGFARHVHLAH